MFRPTLSRRTAKLFRAFGEDYHESKLEEPYIFPAVRQAGGPAAGLPDILAIQHGRGREITDYVLAAAQKGTLSAATSEPLAQALESFVFMYGNHAAREDTIVFPAWKQTLSAEQDDELGTNSRKLSKRPLAMMGSTTRREITAALVWRTSACLPFHRRPVCDLGGRIIQFGRTRQCF